MKISYISDLHLDFYVRLDNEWEKKTWAFLTTLLPEEKGEVLVIAGDISHYNSQSYFTLKFFSTIFEQIIFVLGNHDYYLVSGEQQKKYHRKSMEREAELYNMISQLPNVKLLTHFESFQYKDVSFAGATNWYALADFKEQQFFQQKSNDSVLIKGLDIQALHRLEMCAYQNLQEVDVLITHVPPITIGSHRYYNSTACYLNELPDINARVCIFGHCHEQAVYEKAGIRFCINALGYPDEKLEMKIRQFEI